MIENEIDTVIWKQLSYDMPPDESMGGNWIQEIERDLILLLMRDLFMDVCVLIWTQCVWDTEAKRMILDDMASTISWFYDCCLRYVICFYSLSDIWMRFFEKL